MRAMAILYIGPHRNPDFATDYHISPILAPSHLLAQFPPLLMQCGEKDPFVDDTVIFAGRIREAKRARKVELDLAIAGKSARFGEELRMSVAEPSAPVEGSRLALLKKERDQLAQETEENWVQMVLFSERSHGYLQMPALMSEAKAVIEDLADWIDGAFWKFSVGWERAEQQQQRSSLGKDIGRRGTVKNPSPSSPGRGSSLKKPASPFTSETETEDSAITFVPKRRRSSPMPLDEKTINSTANGVVGGPGSSWSDETLRINHADHPCSPCKKSRTHSSSSKDGSCAEVTTRKIVIDDEGSSTPRAGAGGVTGRGALTVAGKTAGQTISESELMRRRRLLDSHIFDSGGGSGS